MDVGASGRPLVRRLPEEVAPLGPSVAIGRGAGEPMFRLSEAAEQWGPADPGPTICTQIGRSSPPKTRTRGARIVSALKRQ